MAEVSGPSAQSQPDHEVRGFFAKENRILNDIAGGSVFTFRRGKGWAIDPEKGEATYDPTFFEDHGYTPSQAVIGAFHEIRAHLVETAELIDRPGGDREWQRLKAREKKTPWLHIWENHRTDIKGNRAIISFAPSLTSDMRSLYRDKLWPVSDFTDKPRHVQFMDAVLRQAMLPDEPVTIAPEVQEAINKLHDVRGKDVLELATNPRQDPLLALRLSHKYIEPVIKELYDKDLEERKNQKQKKKGKGSASDSQSDSADSEPSQPSDEENQSSNPFEDEYKEHEEKHPEPFKDEDDLDKKIKETVRKQDSSSREKRGYEQEHGISHRDVASYFQEYRHIEDHIEPLREIFRRIVEQRKVPVEHLASLKEEGIMVDPGLIVQTQIESQVGVEAPHTMIDFEGKFVDENVPGKFKLRLVADQSGSMGGEKATQQRRSAILIMESLNEFSGMLGEEQLAIPLDIQTELRSFGVPTGSDTATKLYKPLSKDLTERQRIDYFNGLLETGGSTNDFAVLEEIERDIKTKIASDSLYEAELKSGKMREIVLVLSDGDSDNRALAQEKIKRLRELGVKVVGLGMTAEASGITLTYDPDGRINNNISDLPTTLKEMLEEYLGDLFIR